MTVESQGTEVTEITSTEGGQGNGVQSPTSGVSESATEAKGLASLPTPDSDIVKKAGSVTPAAGTPAAYAPNFKFKLHDKELEFDDWVKGAIKDPETEKKARDIFERAYGLDVVKQDRQTLKTENHTLKERISSTDKALEQLGDYVAKDDFDSFFGELKIPEEKILRYALKLVERNQWSPEQKATWQASKDAERRAETAESRAQQLEARQQQVDVQQREFELNQVMSKPDIAPAVQAYNSGMANPGAFRDLVLHFGNAAAMQGKDISAEEAVNVAMRYLRGANPNLGQTPSQQSSVVQAHGKPVIPNIQGRGTSPVKSAIKSLDDIRKLTRELEARG